MTDRHTVDSINSDQLDELYDDLARARQELADRGAAESADAAAGSYAGRAEEAEARLARVCAEVDRWKLNTLEPQTMRAVSDIGRALDEPGPERAITQPEPWVHIALTSPHPVTANTSALAIADHLTAEFPGVSMQITTNAVEASPSCSPNNPETEPNNSAATEATDIETTARVFAALHRSAEETVTRVIALYEQWVKAGAPPLGVPMSRWWDRRLIELHDAIRPAADESARKTANNPAAPAKDAALRDLHATLSRIRNIDHTPPHTDPDTDTGRAYTSGWQNALNAVRTELVDTPQAEAAPAWTPPPPGDRREQLPDHLLALIRDRLPDYTSTACQTADLLACTATYRRHPLYDEIREHAERLHSRCRLNLKFTGQLCVCGCHPPKEQP